MPFILKKGRAIRMPFHFQKIFSTLLTLIYQKYSTAYQSLS
jgi:hypothetical protein